jgi:predicted CXXCH cytochrome family protein
MRRLSFLILFFIVSSFSSAQSPHGEALKTDCAECHNPVDWNVDLKQVKFDHSTTGFNLVGQHTTTDCISCHSTLKFDLASSQCLSCHQDIHQNSVGSDCQKCHTPNSWIVTNIREIHEESRFPLLGTHLTADCAQCHSGYQNLYFEQLNVDCMACHQNDYNSTTSPNHAAAGFSTECQDCHSIISNNWAAENFNHEFFPLIGGHNIGNCFSCHEQGGNFSGLPTDCYSCHREDYEQVDDPNHVAGNFPTDCTQCHTIFGWEPANFDHNLTQFPLTGAHTNADCISCHSQTFAGTPTVCVECHQDNFNATLDPNHSSLGISTDCQVCHNTTAWIPSTFTHSLTGFELIGQHALAECSSCHEGTTTGLSQECISCHQEDFNLSTNPNHTALSITTDCQTCHTPTENWEPASFPIHNNYYQLLGAHASISNDCMTCHNGNYNTTPNTCLGCHQEDYNNTSDPAHAAAGFSTECLSCHNQNAWTPSTFDHDNQFFPIYSGRHNGEWNTCSDCHTNSTNFAAFSCIDCHEHNQADTDDEHEGVSGYLYNSEACFACHPTGEEGNAFNHSLSNFPLTGSHTTVDCQQCHQQGYSGTSAECYACHQVNYNSTSNPNHQALSISTNCNDCHSTEPGWEPALFPQHNQYFEFTGKHIDIAGDCFSCHSGNYTTISSECLACHQDNYQATQNPNHQAIGLTIDCQSCHTASGWTPSTFDHAITGFALLGQHSVINCSSCHESTAQLSSQCLSCHQDNYSSAPNHVAQNYPTNCEMCHNSVAWSQVTFDHQATAFPLTGTHITVSCSSCHESGFAGTPTECFACHDDSYNNAINPNHQAAGIATDCQSCHNTTAWIPSTFNHLSTGFELLGQHASVQCSSCHQGTTSGLDPLCISCHQDDYNIAPNHISQNYPTTCEMCHNSVAWNQVTFNHQSTNFPLTGGHIGVNCSDCHESGFSGTTTVCSECHLENYNNSTNPSHTALSLPTNCESCHTTNPGWEPSLFPIHNNFYQLLGAHASIANNCITCHNGNYNSTPNTCYGCHQDDYNATNNPPHQSIGFPHECESCHTQNAWSPSTFDHDNQYFPIYSGRHEGEWNLCSDCHTNPTNYSVFSCIDCHEHNQAEMDDEHEGVQGYIYNSQACYNCHPDGEDHPKFFDKNIIID